MRRLPKALAALLALACVSCNTIPSSGAPPANTIEVGQPEVFANADLQAQLDGLRQQLAALTVIDQPSLVNALSNLQGASATQRGVSVQALQRGLPQVTTGTSNDNTTTTGANAGTSTETKTSGTSTGASLAPGVPGSPVPAAPALPSLSLGSIGVLEQELELSSQVLGYELLLSGSDFARYTTSGAAKDKLVIGFPITLNPQAENHDQAAEVQITYYPPNPGQFIEPIEFKSGKPQDLATRNVCHFKRFTDDNARIACLQEESSPTIVNILPTERSYNTVVMTSSASTFGLGALIGTVSVGGSLGFGRQTEYLVAQQDTLALQRNGPGPCPSTVHRKAQGKDAETSAETQLNCDPDSRGVSFVWQFRPVLGAHFVRAGLRRMYVQLAIPFARRPYPNYGGIVEIKTRWRPFDIKKGVLADGPANTVESTETRAVFGHPFVGPLLTDVSVKDLGQGNLFVDVKGNYLIGASVMVGSAALNSSSPGFVSSYNALQFTASAQALAQTGASVVASGGVVTPIMANSLCKSIDAWGECFRTAEELKAARFEVERIEVEPISDSSSMVRVEINGPLDLAEYPYHRYFRQEGNVVGETDDRKPEESPQPLARADFPSLDGLPVLITAGGKAYGLSDQPFQIVLSPQSGNAMLGFIASNDSLNASPELKIQRLFGDPASDSLPVQFVPPGRLQLAPLNHDVPAAASTKSIPAKEPKAKSTKETKTENGKDSKASAPPNNPVGTAKPPQTNCDSAKKVCDYLLTGALADQARLYSPGTPCAGGITLWNAGAYGLNARRVQIPACYKQLTLELPATESRSRLVSEVIALAISPPSNPAIATNVSKTTAQTPTAPHFTLTRSVQDLIESAGVVYVTVGIQKLKDQSATLTVSNADIVSATDGTGSSLSVQAGNQVAVTQDANITFQLRNAARTSVNVVAEGKTGGVSTGKVTFDAAFNIARQPSPAPPAK